MDIPRMPTNTPLDKILGGGIEFGVITNIFGPAGFGKTNIALSTILGCKNKIFYVDTEGSFSTERFQQLGGDEKKMKQVIMMEPDTWSRQHETIMRLEKMIEKDKVDLIIIDSLVALYRLELDESNYQTVNRQLAIQYSMLSGMARKFKIPVLVTNQVYSKRSRTEPDSLEPISDEKIELTSKTIARYWSKCLIEISRGERDNHRIATLRKHRSMPEGKKITFEITEKGMKEVKFNIF